MSSFIVQKDPYRMDLNERTILANNQNCDPKILDIFSTDSSVIIRTMVANNRNTAPETLAKMVDSKRNHNATVLYGLSTNLNSTVKTLQRLYDKTATLVNETEAMTVKTGLLNNPHLPEELLYKLACDEDVNVRRKVADYPNVPQWIISLIDLSSN